MSVEAWLADMGLAEYAAAFAENGVDLSLLPELTNEDLKDLGVERLADRKTILKAIAEAKDESVVGTGDVVDAQSTDNADVSPHEPRSAERRQLTVMFVDLVGSTALAEQLDPEAMRDVIVAYQNTVAGDVTRFEGHVAKYMGDGVLAYFGWPQAHEDDAERSVRAGLAVVESLGAQTKPDGQPVAARVGVATGLVVVGDLVGKGAAQEEAVVGETPNLAARLQGDADPGQVVVSASTRELLGDLFEFDPLKFKKLKGIAEPVDAFAVIGERALESRFSARSAKGILPLIGRDQELALILDRWTQVKSGEGQMVLLTGEAGIGKSRITRAAVDAMTAETLVHMTYQCSPYHGDTALYPVVQQLNQIAGFNKDDDNEIKLDKLERLVGDSTDGLKSVMPLFAALLGIDCTERYGPLELTPQKQRARTLEVLANRVIDLSYNQPLLLVVEDVHWIDPTTLELIDLLLARIADNPVFILATARPDFAHSFDGRSIVTTLSLNRLVREQIIGIVERLTRGKSLPLEVVDEIANKTDGVPLFVEELTKTVLEAGFLRETNDAYFLDRPLDRLAIPSSLHDSLIARLDRLQPVKELAQTAACIGREFDYGLIAVVSRLPSEKLDQSLEQLVDSELVFKRGLPPEAVFTFKHALVRDAAYDSLLKSKRSQLHGCVADALEANFPERAEADPGLLAFHYAGAGQSEKAVAYYLKALDRARDSAASREVINQATQALRLLSNIPESPERDRMEFEIQTALGNTLQLIEGWASPEAVPAFERVVALYGRLGDTARHLDSLRLIYNYHWGQRQYQEAFEVAEKIIAAALEAKDDSNLMIGLWFRAEIYLCRGELAKARGDLEQATTLDPSVKNPTGPIWALQDVLTQVRSTLAFVLWLLGYPEQSQSMSENAITRPRDLGDKPYALAMALHLYLERSLVADPTDVDEGVLEELQALADEHDFTQWQELSSIWQSYRKLLSTQAPADAAEYRRRRRTNTKAIASGAVHGCFVTMVQDLTGDTTGELQYIDEQLDDANRNDEQVLAAEFHRQKGELLLAKGMENTSEAEQCFRTALEIARKQRAKAWELRAATSLARLLQHMDKQSDARNVLTTVYDWFTEGFDTADLVQARSHLGSLSRE